MVFRQFASNWCRADSPRSPGGQSDPHVDGPVSLRRRSVLTVKFHQLSHEFTFGVDMSFIFYPLVLTPLI
jgi:hypothetical protein